MFHDNILTGSLLDENWLPLEQVAALCRVETEWLVRHLDEGLLSEVECVAGTWRFSGAAIQRTRRMHRLESDFDAVPELAALVADLLEELDRLRAQVRAQGS